MSTVSSANEAKDLGQLHALAGSRYRLFATAKRSTIMYRYLRTDH